MKVFTSWLIGGIMGFVGGLGVMLAIFPYLFPPPMVNEKVDQGLFEVVSSHFREGTIGQDVAHWGRGDVKVYQDEDKGVYFIEFQGNFEVGAGPNLWLYVNSEKDINDESDFTGDLAKVRITKVKSFQGSQVYELTAEQFAAGKAITIWCDSFGQYIASANLVA